MQFSPVEAAWLLGRARQIAEQAGFSLPLARSQAIIELARLRAEPKVVLFRSSPARRPGAAR